MKFNIQSNALRGIAIGLAALMAVLVLGGVQAIARVNLIDPWTHQADRTSAVAQFPDALSPLSPDLPGLGSEFPDPLPNLWGAMPFPSVVTRSAAQNAPRQEIEPAHPSNFGDRYTKDINGKSVRNAPIVVLHETVGSADSAINTFQTPHPNEDDQVSYHSLIRRNGTVVYVVPPEKRAFGAGNSVFDSPSGREAVKTHRVYPPSVNNFAYHISLETPSDGANNARGHSGYTNAQYQSLAWLVAQTQIPDSRIATHQGVDRSGSRIDPRSFDGRKFFTLLHRYPRPSRGSELR